jgi:hypothetical protein
VSSDEVLARLRRIYAAIEATLEDNLTTFVPHIEQNEGHWTRHQDFVGGLTTAELANLAHSVIHSVASFPNHLRRWAKKNGRDASRIDLTIKNCPAIQIIIDLWDNDKHGGARQDGGHSRKAPKIEKVERVLRLATASGPVLDVAEVASRGCAHPLASATGPAESGSSVAVIFTSQGPKQVSGSGSARVVVTAQVVEGDGTFIGDLYELEVKALKTWEGLLKDFGILA